MLLIVPTGPLVRRTWSANKYQYRLLVVPLHSLVEVD